MRGNGLLLLLFFLSGTAGLVYEVVWTRMLVLVFGNTLLATSTVLSAYMAGLALGSYLLGRSIDAWAEAGLRPPEPVAGGLGNPPRVPISIDHRPRRLVRLYALLELGIGAFALLFPLLLTASGGIYQALYRHASGASVLLTALRFGVCFLLILVPTAMMGGSLPVLVKQLTGGVGLGRAMALLYGLNTTGAVAGCLLTGFVLLGSVGMRSATRVGVALNIAVAGLAWLLARQPRPAPAPEAADAERSLPRPRAVMIATTAVIGVSGFCSLAYEVLWTRMLSLFLRNSVHSFTTILATFLAGVAFGSLLCHRLMPRLARRVHLLGALQIAIGLAAFATTYVATRHALLDGSTPGGMFLKAAALMLLPTILIGMTLPLAVDLCRGACGHEGETVGRVYAANTFGSVVGPFVAGFVLVPVLGLQRSMGLVAALNLLGGAALLLVAGSRRLRPIVAAATAMAVLMAGVLSGGDRFRRLHQESVPDARIVSYQEGAVADVVVHDFWKEGYQDLYLNGVEEASSRLWHVQLFKLLGALPPLLHPDSKDGLMIAFGAGMSAGAAAKLVAQLDVVELNPDVAPVARAFREENLDVLAAANVRLIVNDGRNHLLLTPRRYDVIISDATHPMSFDSWTLYSQEFYRLVQQRLKPGGIFAQWLPIPLTGDAVKIVLGTFRSVFPHASFWVIPGSSQCLLLATPERLAIDHRALQARAGAMLGPLGLADFGVKDVDKLLSFFFMGEDALGRYLAGFDVVSTDDLPVPQFYGPLDAAGIRASQDMAGQRETVAPYLTNAGVEVGQTLDAYLEIDRALDRGFLRSSPREHERARLLARGTPREADENIKCMLGHDGRRAAYFRERVRQHPADHNAHNSLGYIALREGRLDEAIDELQRAVALKPDFANAMTNLAEALAAAGRFDQAVKAWLHLRDMNPTMRTLHESRAALERIRLLRRGVEPRGDMPDTNPGESEEAPPSGEPTDARTHHLAALRVWNRHPFDGKVDRKTLEEASRLLEEIIESEPTYMPAYADAAALYEALGRFEEGAAIIGRGLEVSPGFREADEQKRRLALMGQLKRGVLPQEKPALLREVSQLHARSGDLELAIRYLEQAVQMDPSREQDRVALAALRERAGIVEKAPGAPNLPPAQGSGEDPCKPLPREGARCSHEQRRCLISSGPPRGRSAEMLCQGGRWIYEEELNPP